MIVATFGRSEELIRLFDSLVLQRYPDLEVVVVDQNCDDRVLRVVAEFSGRLNLIHRVSKPGASRARNVGLALATSDIIGFPDDDCWYPPGVLERVAQFLDAGQEWDGIIGHTIDAEGKATLPWSDRAGPLSPAMSWRRAVTYVYFLRRDVALGVGGFDTTLGPGAGSPWGAGDDNDFMLRALKTGAKVYFDPALTVHHPPLFPSFDGVALEKRERYARADGRVLRKHPMPLWWKLAFFGMPLARWMVSLASLKRNELRFHWVTFVGRVRGYRDRLPE
ncbi:MAG: glycosyltransferase family 2 protein [Rhodocyclales bacterium]|nr:glycosyltransferase family 2 protein [Rhodocyclales bacterium]